MLFVILPEISIQNIPGVVGTNGLGVVSAELMVVLVSFVTVSIEVRPSVRLADLPVIFSMNRRWILLSLAIGPSCRPVMAMPPAIWVLPLLAMFVLI